MRKMRVLHRNQDNLQKSPESVRQSLRSFIDLKGKLDLKVKRVLQANDRGKLDLKVKRAYSSYQKNPEIEKIQVGGVCPLFVTVHVLVWPANIVPLQSCEKLGAHEPGGVSSDTE